MVGDLLIGNVIDRALQHLLLDAGEAETRPPVSEQEAERGTKFAPLSLLAGESERDALAAVRI